jgi:hypothetical protein
VGPDGKWIFLEDRGGAYPHQGMVKAAFDRIYAKIDDYETVISIVKMLYQLYTALPLRVRKPC